jgi:UDP-N-acetylmuramoyl-tripeptide--D-alanyl-D-alanine ligase
VKLKLHRVAEFTGAVGNFELDATVEGYSIDSRTIKPGELFLAVKGERLDGHDYVEAALQNGALAAVIDRRRVARFADTSKLLVVDDTLVALQALGAAVRRRWGKSLVAVTGSAGKTTTKEAIAHVLASRFRVMKSEGNLNNHFGLPLQLLKLEPEHEIAVIELGMSHAGEIAALAKLAHPDIGVVTNVAPVHLEFFASIADIARAKYELIQELHSGAIAILNADDEYVSQFGRDFHGKVVHYGIRHQANVCGLNVQSLGEKGSSFDLVANSVRQEITLPLLGEHNVYNALAAAAVAMERGITPSEIAGALAALSPADKRGEKLSIAGATVINDCYNSNPKALQSMVDALATMPATRRIVVAGEMLELGPQGEALHFEAGHHMAEKKIDRIIGVRGLGQKIVEGAKASGAQAEFVDTPEQAAEWLKTEIRAGDVVLLKASRGVRLEKALELWKSSTERSAAKQG